MKIQIKFTNFLCIIYILLLNFIDFFLASKNCYQKIIVLKIIKKILLKFQL